MSVIDKVNALANRLAYPEDVTPATKAFAWVGPYADRGCALIKVGDRLVLLHDCRPEKDVSGMLGLGYNVYGHSFVLLCGDLGLLTKEEVKEWQTLQNEAVQTQKEERRVDKLRQEAEALGYFIQKRKKK